MGADFDLVRKERFEDLSGKDQYHRELDARKELKEDNERILRRREDERLQMLANTISTDTKKDVERRSVPKVDKDLNA